MNDEKPQPTATFQNVSVLGAGYLAITWALLRLISIEGATDFVYATALFGIMIQLAFALVFRLQRQERSTMLRVSKKKLSIFRDEGDVVLLMLNCLVCLIMGWMLLYGLLALFAALHPHSLMRRLMVP